MSCSDKNVEVEIDLEDADIQTLIKAYKILRDIRDDLWTEDLEDTEEYFRAEEASGGLQRFLEQVGIDYSQD